MALCIANHRPHIDSPTGGKKIEFDRAKMEEAPTIGGILGAMSNCTGHRRQQSKDVVIVGAARTPVGAFNGSLSGLPAHMLGKVAIQEALKRAKVAGADVSEVILGQILTAGEGQGPARQASIAAGLPIEVPAWSLNQLCGSGLRAVALGTIAIQNGDASIIVAGGQESMSMAPHVAHLRNGTKMGSLEVVDSMIKDALTDAFYGYHMGNTAENIAKQFQITRQQQDEFAVSSQNKAEGGAEGWQVQGRDRAGGDHHQEGRRHHRRRRASQARHDA